jgi:hypothetical protein
MVNFLPKLLQIISYLPSIIVGIEQLWGSKNGEQKKNVAVDMVSLTLGITECISAKDIVDNDAFQDGLKQTIDGVVKMLNASIWHKK